LLDKIALYGSVSDCEKLNIKRGTVLAQAPTQDGEPVIAKMLKPMVAIKKNGVGEHLLLVTNSDAGSSRALPDGIRCARVFCYVGTEAPNNFKQYTSVGNAKRGLFLNKFTEALPATDKTYYAWYIAVYEDTKGNLLDLSEPLRVEIFMSKG
jgi:wyosine [tRNA(Phe)-imidazoG37] synthetase (radical SAM superfamily)